MLSVEARSVIGSCAANGKWLLLICARKAGARSKQFCRGPDRAAANDESDSRRCHLSSNFYLYLTLAEAGFQLSSSKISREWPKEIARCYLTGRVSNAASASDRLIGSGCGLWKWALVDGGLQSGLVRIYRLKINVPGDPKPSPAMAPRFEFLFGSRRASPASFAFQH